MIVILKTGAIGRRLRNRAPSPFSLLAVDRRPPAESRNRGGRGAPWLLASGNRDVSWASLLIGEQGHQTGGIT